MVNKKTAAQAWHGRKNMGLELPTSYGGMTRFRFEGSLPRVGKSRLNDQ
jgi:hypothetical protein